MTPAQNSLEVREETFLKAWGRAHPEVSNAFEQEIFWKALYPHARGFAKLVWHLWPQYFTKDLELIRRLAMVNSSSEAHFEIENFRYQHREFGFFRRTLRLRVSGKRLILLVKRAMRQDKVGVSNPA